MPRPARGVGHVLFFWPLAGFWSGRGSTLFFFCLAGQCLMNNSDRPYQNWAASGSRLLKFSAGAGSHFIVTLKKAATLALKHLQLKILVWNLNCADEAAGRKAHDRQIGERLFPDICGRIRAIDEELAAKRKSAPTTTATTVSDKAKRVTFKVRKNVAIAFLTSKQKTCLRELGSRLRSSVETSDTQVFQDELEHSRSVQASFDTVKEEITALSSQNPRLLTKVMAGTVLAAVVLVSCLRYGSRPVAEPGNVAGSRLPINLTDSRSNGEQTPSHETPASQIGFPRITTPNRPQVSASPLARESFAGFKAGEEKELVPGISFHWCPAGQFVMGEGTNAVEVKLSSGFWLGETEVTQGQWEGLMGTAPWRENDLAKRRGDELVKEGSDYAASYISHDDAVRFAEKLTSQERSAKRLPEGWKYTLPTEAQWEYACRAGTKTKYSFGDNESLLSEFGWWGGRYIGGNVGSEKYAHRVGQKKSNGWGLKDMHGNVYEWCSDWGSRLVTGGTDPAGTSFGSSKVNRGGGWGGRAPSCRSAYRNRNAPDDTFNDLGFRVAAVPSTMFPQIREKPKQLTEEQTREFARRAEILSEQRQREWEREVDNMKSTTGAFENK